MLRATCATVEVPLAALARLLRPFYVCDSSAVVGPPAGPAADWDRSAKPIEAMNEQYSCLHAVVGGVPLCTELAVARPVEMNVEDDEDDADYQTPSHQSQRSSGVRTPCTRTSGTRLRAQYHRTK